MLSTRNPSLLAPFALLIVVLAIAVVPMPGSRMRSVVRQLRSPEPNRADREAHSGGYYLGLIEGGADASRDELSMRLMGKTSDWKSFHEIDATKYLRGDFLQFELKPNVRETMFGRSFTTNSKGLRDREYRVEKPPGVFRIALLGSSMDMGWGVGTDETYENQLEDWLNLHAAKRGIPRRFEVVNFAMAAYSPLHRVESFRRKALAYKPDLVLYSATMLDTRLLEINLRNLVIERIAPPYDFLRSAMNEMDIRSSDRKADKDVLKAKIRPHLDEINSAAIENLKVRCQSEGIPLAMLLVPRVGESDSPENRAAGVAKFTAVAKSLDLPLLDLSATFDDRDPASIEIAAWDDHPNSRGHELLFHALARRLVDDEGLYRLLFLTEPPR